MGIGRAWRCIPHPNEQKENGMIEAVDIQHILDGVTTLTIRRIMGRSLSRCGRG
jgi:hypothetical protein